VALPNDIAGGKTPNLIETHGGESVVVELPTAGAVNAGAYAGNPVTFEQTNSGGLNAAGMSIGSVALELPVTGKVQRLITPKQG